MDGERSTWTRERLGDAADYGAEGDPVDEDLGLSMEGWGEFGEAWRGDVAVFWVDDAGLALAEGG